MASRKEQKERARETRLAAEREAAAKAARARRIRLGGGGVLVVAVVAALVAVIASGGGSGSGTGVPITPAPNGVKLPAPKISDLAAAAKAAGCVSIDTPDSIARAAQNRMHVDPSTKLTYQTNPASYGPHYPTPASDGEYKPGGTPQVGFLVHAMEHGRVEYQYRPGLAQADINELEALFNETEPPWAPGQLLLLFQNTTGMPYDVAATAWGHVLGCKSFKPAVFDALRDFRVKYTNQGPEQLGTAPE
ncbi:MAG: DUF3105 domain-containing protein [Actinomycetota bacterium]|nr:DUF3105 domain-containing protein [Actinomycetota bacterium]